MSFYKKMKEDAKRQKEDILEQGQGYYHAAAFEHYGQAQKKYFSWARVITYAACIALILAAGTVWGLSAFTDNGVSQPSDALSDYVDGAAQRYLSHSLIYKDKEMQNAINTDFNGDYALESDIAGGENVGLYIKKLNGVVLNDLSAFNGQGSINYKVFVNGKGKDMFYHFSLTAQNSQLDIITFINESYSAAKYKNGAEKITMGGKTLYLKTWENNGQTQYQVFYQEEEKGVCLFLSTSAENADTLLKNILSSLTD